MNRQATTEPWSDPATIREVLVRAGPVTVEGDLGMPANAQGIVLFAHGSGSSRRSSRNRHVAHILQGAGMATLLIDLLTADEEAVDRHTTQFRFDIGLLAERLVGAADWLGRRLETSRLPLGLFGASTGAAAALVAAASRPTHVRAVVSRGGRPDLAGSALPYVQAPTLLIVGGNDTGVIELNREAMQQLGVADKQMVLVPGATHLFEEPGALEEVARLAAHWFGRHLGSRDASAAFSWRRVP
jgi:dienelactone hydrolase